MRRVDSPGDNALGDEFQALWDAIRSIRMGTQGILVSGTGGTGDPGPAGSDGAPGPAGATGPPGADGADGEDANVDYGPTPPEDPEPGHIWMDTTAPEYFFGDTEPPDPDFGDVWFDTSE